MDTHFWKIVSMLMLVLGMVLAGCIGGDKAQEPPSPSAQPTQDAEEPTPIVEENTTEETIAQNITETIDDLSIDTTLFE